MSTKLSWSKCIGVIDHAPSIAILKMLIVGTDHHYKMGILKTHGVVDFAFAQLS